MSRWDLFLLSRYTPRQRPVWSPKQAVMDALDLTLDGMTRSRVHDAVATPRGVHLPYVYPMQGSTP